MAKKSTPKAAPKCVYCKKSGDLRFGVCYSCCEAMSIIRTGTDMLDEGLNGKPAKTVQTKLQLLIKKGWKISK